MLVLALADTLALIVSPCFETCKYVITIFMLPPDFLYIISDNFSVMEQSDAGKRHNHSVLIAGLNNMIVANGTAGLCHVFHPASVGSFDIVAKREEGVGAQGNAAKLIEPCSFFIMSEYFGLYLENILPSALRKYVHIVLADVVVNGVVSVRAAYTVNKLQA